MSVIVPSGVLTAFRAYGFDEEFFDLSKVKATRKTKDWFAVLFETSDGLVAVDFVPDSEDEWEVQNDHIGPFDSVSEFVKGPLSSTFF